MLKNILFILTFIFYFQIVFSQGYTDVVNISFQSSPTSIKKNDAEGFSRTIKNVYLNLPISITKSTYFITGGSLERQSFTSVNSYTLSEFNFYSSSIYVGVQKQFTNKYKLLFLCMPKIAADRLHFTFSDIQFREYTVLKIKKNDALQYNIGLYFNNEYYGLNVTPLLGVDWQASSKLRLSCTLPQKLNIEYKLKPYLFVGHQLQSQKRSFKIYELGHSYYLKEGDHTFGSTSLSLYTYFFFKNLAFTTELGYVLNDYYTLYDSNSVKLDHDLFSQSQHRLMFQAKFNYRVFTE